MTFMATSICDRLRAGVTTASADETRALAAALAAALPPDTVLALHGTLGVGKTTFVQGLAEGLGVAGPVGSPTFNLLTLHRGGARLLAHLDAYRLDGDGVGAAESLMLEDFLVSPWCLAVEWPEKISAWLPRGAWHLDLGIASDGRHTVRLR
jgi:tRNA threonylcarbamoyladenosine biosynthesis protein TsaE